MALRLVPKDEPNAAYAEILGNVASHLMLKSYEEKLRPGAEAATQALGAARYRELHERGAEMSVDEATAFLLEA